jgi:NAD(P)-dependent dehydrogenase (short-subunit alcohol dehydrogenase family)
MGKIKLDNRMDNMKADLLNKTYVVTGATSGIGLAVAVLLVQRGADVIGVGRSIERCRQVEKNIRTANPGVQVDYLTADLSVQASVRRLAEQVEQVLYQRGISKLDGLVNNAGTFTTWFSQTPDGIETQWAVNHLAPFLLTHCLLGLLRAAPAARVVTVSSDSHYHARIDWSDPQRRRGYNGLCAYGSTKLTNILFTLELNRQLGPVSTVRAFAADPGLVKTDIGMKGTPGLVGWLWKLRRAGGISAEQSAEGIVYLLAQEGILASGDIYWKHGRPVRPSKLALDSQASARLWALSAQMCGLSQEVAHV